MNQKNKISPVWESLLSWARHCRSQFRRECWYLHDASVHRSERTTGKEFGGKMSARLEHINPFYNIW